jgi:hypothetical protein
MIVAVTAIVTVAVVVAVAVALVVVLAMAVAAAVVEVLAVAVAVVVVLAVAAAVVVVLAVAVAVAGASSVTSGRTWFLPCTLQKTKTPLVTELQQYCPCCCPTAVPILWRSFEKPAHQVKTAAFGEVSQCSLRCCCLGKMIQESRLNCPNRNHSHSHNRNSSHGPATATTAATTTATATAAITAKVTIVIYYIRLQYTILYYNRS